MERPERDVDDARTRRRARWSGVRGVLLAGLIVLPLRSAVADWNVVPTGSMEPTILPGDRIFVNKLAYGLRVPFTKLRLGTWSAPDRGDVVVLLSPSDGTRLVKRVVAVPGDEVALRDDVLWLNGRPSRYEPLSAPTPARVSGATAAAPATAAPDQRLQALERPPLGVEGEEHSIQLLPTRPALRDFGPIRIPAGEYLVLGDNRNASADSRVFGLVPEAQILGEAEAVIFSLDPERTLGPRWSRFFADLDASR